jgi:hypothetical protein
MSRGHYPGTSSHRGAQGFAEFASKDGGLPTAFALV